MADWENGDRCLAKWDGEWLKATVRKNYHPHGFEVEFDDDNGFIFPSIIDDAIIF